MKARKIIDYYIHLWGY